MRQKTDAGWTYGSERNYDLRLHPLIIAHGDLTEAQKELDREPVRHILTLLSGGWGVKREDNG